MEVHNEIMIFCKAPDAEGAKVKFGWFISLYAEDNELEYFYIGRVEALSTALAGLFIKIHFQEYDNRLDDIQHDIFKSIDIGDCDKTNYLTTIYQKSLRQQFDHTQTLIYYLDCSDETYPSYPFLEENEVPAYWLTKVVFQ